MLRCCIIATSAIAVVNAGGAVAITSGDIASNPLGIPDVAGTFNQELNLLGRSKAQLSLIFDTKTKKMPLKVANLQGAIDRFKYGLTHKFADKSTGVVVSTTESGVLLKASAADATDLKGSTLTATKSLAIADKLAVTLEPSYALKTSVAKLKIASSVDVGMGASLSGAASLNDKLQVTGSSYELEYEADLGNGRTLSATIDSMESGTLVVTDGRIEKGASEPSPLSTLHSSASTLLGSLSLALRKKSHSRSLCSRLSALCSRLSRRRHVDRRRLDGLCARRQAQAPAQARAEVLKASLRDADGAEIFG